ncbi:MAG: hypothetical protein QHC78_02900 [Pigmentiphaga sp.]|uniref:DUF4286 family protein n=1 Tax=Pigmentiphaga sp. TaxID=1977564 RepID=UPI0029B547A3|nr:DUF4286 family protein [Pigmentiphaga sp.]MDX3904622.1 hypothetical protein [Pigmentiphaga sp.]
MSKPAALLLRYSPAPGDVAALERVAAEAVARYPGKFERVDANRALDGAHLYLYFWSGDPFIAGDEPTAGLASLSRRLVPEVTPEIFLLTPVLDLPGVSHGQTAHFHYVVETDVRPEVARDLNGWYEQEHLPGLAAVPGNIRARRLVAANADGSQRSFACYDLVTSAIKQDPAWLAVRATDWSSRVRPHFQNTRRVMCERLFAIEPGKGAS